MPGRRWDKDCSGYATEWSSGSTINLGGLAGSDSSEAFGINDSGLVVGYSIGISFEDATEWSDSDGVRIIDLGGLPGYAFSQARDVNDAGQVVGCSPFFQFRTRATEWSGGVGGSILDLGGLPGSH